MMSEQGILRDSTLELVTKTLADDCITEPTPIKWQSETSRLLCDIYEIVDVAQLPQYLSDEDDLVRTAAEAKLRLLSYKSKGVHQDES